MSTTSPFRVGAKVAVTRTGDTGRIVPLTDWPDRRPESWSDETMVIVRWDEFMPPFVPAPRAGGLRYSLFTRAEAQELLTVVASAPAHREDAATALAADEDDEPTAGGPCEHVEAHHGVAGSGLDGCDECGVTWRRPADRCLATVMVFDGVDSGELGPCDRPATGTRRDVTGGTPFPVCDEHAEIVEPFDTGGRPSPFAPPPGAPPALGGRIPDTTPAPVEPAGAQLDRDDAAARVLNAALEWLSAPDGDDVRETMLLADATRDYRQVVAR